MSSSGCASRSCGWRGGVTAPFSEPRCWKAPRASAETLGQRLIAPLAERLGERPLVIVPTGSLHAMPWAMLPQLRGRPVVVAPSAATWSALQARPAARRSKVVLVAGPRLRHATAEVDALGGLYPRAGHR